jgi:hypothetical protein
MILKILRPEKAIDNAAKLIDRLKKINHLNFDIPINFDYNLKYAGEYLQYEKNKILINPTLCGKSSSISCPGYTNDDSVFGTILHEFAHYLSMTYFKGFINKYEKTFKKPLTISLYHVCKNDVTEEIAELLMLYISNSYFLKLISKDHFNFFKGYFKSPTSCNKRRFIKIYNKFPDKTKQHIKNKWKIEVLGELVMYDGNIFS